MNRKLFTIASVLVLLAALLPAGRAWSRPDAAALLAEARAAYDRGDYPAAIQTYQTLLVEGLDRAEIYYNLGNAEFRAGHVGRAIAAYRSALKRAPGDEDVRFNLNYAKAQVRQPPDPNGPLTRLLERWFMRWPGQVLTLAAWAVYAGFAVCIGVLVLRRGQGLLWRWLAAIFGMLFLVAAAWAAFRLGAERDVAWGVVVAGQAEARNGPGEENQVGFTVPEGREVRVLGREGDWIAIGLPIEGYKGWVKAAEIQEDR